MCYNTINNHEEKNAMAIIKCVECGRDVSNKATVCPQCGCPIYESTKASEIKQNEQQEKIKNQNKPKGRRK